jgi:hypothetical protein
MGLTVMIMISLTIGTTPQFLPEQLGGGTSSITINLNRNSS